MCNTPFTLIYHALSTSATTASSKMERGEKGPFVPHAFVNACSSLRCSQAVSIKHNDETVAALRVGRIRIGTGSYVASQSSITQGVSLPANSRVECDACDPPLCNRPVHLFTALQLRVRSQRQLGPCRKPPAVCTRQPNSADSACRRQHPSQHTPYFLHHP